MNPDLSITAYGGRVEKNQGLGALITPSPVV